MIQEISDKLKSMFETLQGTGQPFRKVYDYHTLENEGYPYLCFELTDFTAEILDNCKNIRTFTFRVLIFQEFPENGGRGVANQIIVKAMDDVIAMVDQNYTLDGLVTQVRPTSGTLDPFTMQSGKCLVGSIVLEIEAIASVN